MTYPLSLHHAVETLLWCSFVVAPSDPERECLYADDYELAPDSWPVLAKEWSDFRDQLDNLGFEPETAYLQPLHPDNDGDYLNQVAHDWILTRNHHGAGFWDGRLAAPWGDKLTRLSQSRPELVLYLGDDGFIHLDC